MISSHADRTDLVAMPAVPLRLQGLRMLVTGANGFLGSEIARCAVASGCKVRGLTRRGAGDLDGVEFQHADILTPSRMVEVSEGVDVVVHAAGMAHVRHPTQESALQLQHVNEQGVANVVQAAVDGGVRHVVLISSVSVYGSQARQATEKTHCIPEGPYAVSKFQGEIRAKEIAEASGLRLTILRMATLYGDDDPGNVGRLMRAIDRRRFIRIGSGNNRKSLLHRRDAATAVLLAAVRDRGPWIETYNVAGKSVRMRDVVCGLAEALGRNIPSLTIPAGIVQSALRLVAWFKPTRKRGTAWKSTLEKWLGDDEFDAEKFREELGFKPAVELSEGLRQQVSTFRKRQSMEDAENHEAKK
jgi:nucleoside-diphosphate-sugar epimerase